MPDKYEELFNSLGFDIAKMASPSPSGCPSQGQVELAKGWLHATGYSVENLRERFEPEGESEQ